jgi:hypothetical protein
MTLAGLTEVQLELGALESAEPIARCRNLAMDVGDQLGAVEADRLRATWYLRQGRAANAVAAAEAARAGARQLGAIGALRERDQTAADAWESAGNRLVASARRDEARLLAELLESPDPDLAPAPF